MSEYPNPLPKRGLGSTYVPINLSSSWDALVILKVKNYRALAMGGVQSYRVNRFEVPQATGFIELVGSRVGAVLTSLLVGFSDSADIPSATFTLQGNEAVGTLVLRGQYFAPWLEMAKAPNAHFRLGGNGLNNALATDSTLLGA